MFSILRAHPYPFHNSVAQQLHVFLTQLHPTTSGAVLIARQAGLDTGMIDPGQPPYFVWADVLTLAASSGLSRQLVQTVYDRLHVNSPGRSFLAGLLDNRPTLTDDEPRAADGTPQFLRN